MGFVFAVTTTFRNSDLNCMVLLWAAANRDSVLADRDSCRQPGGWPGPGDPGHWYNGAAVPDRDGKVAVVFLQQNILGLETWSIVVRVCQ